MGWGCIRHFTSTLEVTFDTSVSFAFNSSRGLGRGAPLTHAAQRYTAAHTRIKIFYVTFTPKVLVKCRIVVSWRSNNINYPPYINILLTPFQNWRLELHVWSWSLWNVVYYNVLPCRQNGHRYQYLLCKQTFKKWVFNFYLLLITLPWSCWHFHFVLSSIFQVCRKYNLKTGCKKFHVHCSPA